MWGLVACRGVGRHVSYGGLYNLQRRVSLPIFSFLEGGLLDSGSKDLSVGSRFYLPLFSSATLVSLPLCHILSKPGLLVHSWALWLAVVAFAPFPFEAWDFYPWLSACFHPGTLFQQLESWHAGLISCSLGLEPTTQVADFCLLTAPSSDSRSHRVCGVSPGFSRVFQTVDL